MVWAVMEGNRIWKMSRDRKELEDYLKEFPIEERRKMRIVLLEGGNENEK
jgi:hypothetical protein